MMAALSFALVFAGFAALSLSMERHHRQVWGRLPKRRAALAYRLAGLGLITAGLAPAVAVWGGSVGVVAWLGELTVGALAVALLLTSLPSAVPWASAAALLLGAAAAWAAGSAGVWAAS